VRKIDNLTDDELKLIKHRLDTDNSFVESDQITKLEKTSGELSVAVFTAIKEHSFDEKDAYVVVNFLTNEIKMINKVLLSKTCGRTTFEQLSHAKQVYKSIRKKAKKIKNKSA